MNNVEFSYLIKNAQYKTKYEPIIDIETNEIYGYEALSKFEIDQSVITTDDVFKKLHHYNKLFFELEKRNKNLQVENYDKKEKLFLNFDADIVRSKEQQTYWENFFLVNNNKIVVEITENGSDDETSATIMRNFSQWLNDRGIDSALDDFAQDGSMFSFYIMDRSKYIKIDKSFIFKIRENPNYIPYLKGLLETIKLNNQKSIIEGVETKEDFDLVKSLNCDYVQGYYFSDLILIR